MDRYLYLGQADEAKLINPSISRLLRSAEETRWVASEMRRALGGSIDGVTAAALSARLKPSRYVELESALDIS